MAAKNDPVPVRETEKPLELTITRRFDAPARLIFNAWSKAEFQAQWLGPAGFTVPSCEVDFRVGGKYRAHIRSPEGADFVLYGVYREIVEPSRLVFTFAWEEEGERGLETLVTITFAAHGDKTTMVFTQAPFQSVAERDGHFGGWSECLDKLAAYAAKLAA